MVVKMIKLQADEYGNLVSEIEMLHKESIEFINGYITELDSILVSSDGFHTEKVSEKIKVLLEIFRGRLLPGIKDMFGEIERRLHYWEKMHLRQTKKGDRECNGKNRYFI